MTVRYIPVHLPELTARFIAADYPAGRILHIGNGVQT